MSPDQRKMCFAEWRKCWDAMLLASDGQTPLSQDEARAKLTVKAIGHAKSWGAPWTQKEVDWLLAVIWAVSQSGNFELQMRQQNQPLTRAEGSVCAHIYLDAIRDAAAQRGEHELAERLRTPGGRESYLNGIVRRIHKCELCDVDDGQWRDVLSALNHTRLHKEEKSHSHPRWHTRKSQQSATPRRTPGPHAPATSAPARTGSIVSQGDDEELF